MTEDTQRKTTFQEQQPEEDQEHDEVHEDEAGDDDDVAASDDKETDGVEQPPEKGEVTIHDETKALQGEGMAAGWQPGVSGVDGQYGGKGGPKKLGRRKINIEFIEDKSRRHITFSKRKAGIMKKAYELSTLTGTQVLLLVASETGHVYTFATPKLQPLITKPEGKQMIQACLNSPDNSNGGSGMQGSSGSFSSPHPPNAKQPAHQPTMMQPPSKSSHEKTYTSSMPTNTGTPPEARPFSIQDLAGYASAAAAAAASSPLANSLSSPFSRYAGLLAENPYLWGSGNPAQNLMMLAAGLGGSSTQPSLPLGGSGLSSPLSSESWSRLGGLGFPGPGSSGNDSSNNGNSQQL